MYFAHEIKDTDLTLPGRIGHELQHPSVAIPLITLAAILLMYLSLWALKKYTTWNFPINERTKK
jgi:hypothetical protein